MFVFGRRLIMRRMSNFDEESEYQDFTEMQNRYDADRSRESRNFRYRNDEAYDRCAVPRNHRAYDRPFYNFSSEVPHTSHDSMTRQHGDIDWKKNRSLVSLVFLVILIIISVILLSSDLKQYAAVTLVIAVILFVGNSMTGRKG